MPSDAQWVFYGTIAVLQCVFTFISKRVMGDDGKRYYLLPPRGLSRESLGCAVWIVTFTAAVVVAFLGAALLSLL